MLLKVFAVKDKAMDSYSAPFTQATMESGIRMFRELVTYDQTDNKYKRSPEDYSLYYIGEYNDATGEMMSHDVQRLSSVVELLTEKET